MKNIWSPKTILPAVMIAALYVVVTVYLMNAGLVMDAMFGTHSAGYRQSILIALLTGMWTAMSAPSLFLLVVVAMLTGLNLMFVLERLRTVRSSGKMHLAVGGSSLLGIVGSGCASCGLPILAFLGLGGAAASLPFRGMELSILTVALLSVSLYILVKGRERQAVCAVGTMEYQDRHVVIPE